MTYRPMIKPLWAPCHFERWPEQARSELAERKRRGETNRQIAAAMGRTAKAIKHQWERRP